MEPQVPNSQALPAGTRIEEFVIERVLGSGGFGITHLASDTSLGRQVVIKENLPVQFCFRNTHSLTVAPRHTQGDDAENFRWSLENVSREAALGARTEARSCVGDKAASAQEAAAEPVRVPPARPGGKAKVLPRILVNCVVLGLAAWGVISCNRPAPEPPEVVKVTDDAAARAEETARQAEIGSRAGEEREFEIAAGVTLTMCWIPPGEFVMGSPADELGRDDDETQHRVTLTQGFWLGKYEVTQAQWEAVMGRNPSHFKGSNLPVEVVSWDDISQPGGFLEKANRQGSPNGRFRLPTEAQWEYACRAGTTTALNSGKNLTSTEGACPNLDEVGWYSQNSDSKTHPVGQKKANAWGLHDMHGNVWEWCADWYEAYPQGAATDPTGPNNGSYRVFRGGSWYDIASRACCAYRYCYSPSCADFDYGFRLARGQP
jgi:formylglycine-generating enzyme required for sulfatase activity